MTPLWFLPKVLHVLAINTESHLYMTSLRSHNSSLYHLRYINNVRTRSIRTTDYATTMSRFQFRYVGKGGGWICATLSSAEVCMSRKSCVVNVDLP